MAGFLWSNFAPQYVLFNIMKAVPFSALILPFARDLAGSY